MRPGSAARGDPDLTRVRPAGFLASHPRQAFTREQLLAQVWDWSFGDTSTVTVHVRRLREKLERDSRLPRRIVTVWGVGYRYEPEEA